LNVYPGRAFLNSAGMIGIVSEIAIAPQAPKRFCYDLFWNNLKAYL